MPGQPPNSAKATSGRVDAVPCAHCGTTMDLRPAKESGVLDTAIDVTCDTCHKTSRVVGVKDVTMVALKQK